MFGSIEQRIEMAVADLASEDRHHWTSHMLSQRVAEFMALRERLDAEVLRVTGQWDRHLGLGRSLVKNSE